MADVLGKVSSAVSAGLDRVANSIGYKPLSDIEIYKKLKANNFSGMIEKYGHERTLAYIQTFEDKLKETANG